MLLLPSKMLHRRGLPSACRHCDKAGLKLSACAGSHVLSLLFLCSCPCRALCCVTANNTMSPSDGAAPSVSQVREHRAALPW